MDERRVDLGPKRGDAEEIVREKRSYTGQFLELVLVRRRATQTQIQNGWEHTFSELSNDLSPYPDADNPFFPQPFEDRTIVPLSNPKYATAMLKGAQSFAHQVLLERTHVGWKCIGHYVDDTISLDPNAPRIGLATELFLRCMEHRTLPLTTKFTQSGFNLLRRAHRIAIGRAIEAGLMVPKKVLEDYLEIK
jgi:hypothetical protein